MIMIEDELNVATWAVEQAELLQVFDQRTSEILLRVMEQVTVRSRDERVRREDFRELRRVVTQLSQNVNRLAAAQGRTEERLEELAAAQGRTEERLEELAAAQGRTEERLEELAAAQGRTERALVRLQKQVGGLSDTVGGDIEDIAYIVLHDVLGREFGWEVGVLERTWQTWGREPEEVNVFGQAIDPKRPEQVIWIVGEAKHNLTVTEVNRFGRQVERAREHLEGEVFPVCFCYRARPEVRELLQDLGLRLVFSYGKLM